ncbi:putative DNA-directed DNA polymerase [Helianthus debilis subsp. tardiflorus]
MGSKKRSSDSVEVDNHKSDTNVDELRKTMKKMKKGRKDDGEVTNPVNLSSDDEVDKVSSERSKKKLKKGKKSDGEVAVTNPKSNDNKSSADKPMERKKKRKALDKEKHRASSADNGEVKAKVESLEVKEVENRASNGLPEFHIGVFKDLGSADVSVREAATERLVMELKEVQKAYDMLEKKEDVEGEGELKLEAEKNDGLNNCAPSVRYAVRRLIRGVSSSRECARQGFALGLTMLVGEVSSISLDSLLKLIVDLLEVSSSMKGQEIKDCLLGRLFAYGSLARSGRLIQQTDDDDSEHVKAFTSSVISLATKKRYLQEPAVEIISQLSEKLPVEVVLKQVLEAPGLHEWFEGAIEAGNPDALLLALKLREKVAADDKLFGKLLPDSYSSSTLFSIDHLSSLANCFKESTFCQPRVHGVWPVLVNILLPEISPQHADSATGLNSAKKHKKSRKSSSYDEDIQKNLQNFWDIIIERSLLLSSHDRKHLVFDIILLVLPRLPVSCIPIVFSFKIIQCLVDILSTKDSWLYKFAEYFLKELLEWVSHDDGRRVAVTMAMQKHSNGKFDSITRTKTVKDLMSGFSTKSGCMLFIQNLIDMFLDVTPASEEPSDQSQTTDDNSEIGSIEEKSSVEPRGTSDFLKSWVVDSVPSVLKHSKLDNEEKFCVQKEILKFLAVQGLFSSSLGTEVTSFDLDEKFRWPKTATSSSLRGMCIEQLELLLANAQKGEGPHAVASGREANDLGSYFMRFLSILRNIPSVSLFRALSDDDEKAFRKLQAMETQLSREERNCGMSADANKLHALRYLLIQLLLQLLLRPGEFSEAVSEITICCKKLFPSPDPLDSDDEPDDNDDDEAPELMDVLVDTLLSLLPQSSAPMRSAIEQVFKYYSEDVTDNGLFRMLKVIKKDLKPARHQETDSDDEDDDDDDDLLEIEEAEDSDSDDEAETGDNTADGDDGDLIEQSEDSEGGTIGKEPNEEQDSDESDGGMDDEAMFRMDSYLAQIFKEKRNQAGGETAHSQLVLFKLRVLSLLEIYLHENRGKPQVLRVFTNLAQAFVNPHTTEGSEQLGDRICKIIEHEIFKAKHYPRGESVQLSVLEPLLEKNLKLAAKPFKKKKSAVTPSKKKQSASFQRYRKIVNLAQNSTYWILKLIDSRSFSEDELERVYDMLKNTMVRYFDDKNSQLKPQFLKEIFRRWPWVGQHFFGFLVDKCAGAKSKFRQVEALDLILEILKPHVLVKDGNDEGKEMISVHLSRLSNLIKELVTNMPEKQAKRAEVRKFCGNRHRVVIWVLLKILSFPCIQLLGVVLLKMQQIMKLQLQEILLGRLPLSGVWSDVGFQLFLNHNT